MLPGFVKPIAVLLLVILAVLLIFASGGLVVVTMFVATALLAVLINISRIRVLGIEFATFTGVVAALAFSPLAGAIVAAVMILVHMAVAQYLGPYIVWVVPSYAIGAFVAGSLGGSVAVTGLYATILINFINVLMTAIIYRHNLGNYMPYLVTNIIINVLLFAVFGEAALAAMLA